jgi:AraC-like DNA-binding protein
MALPTAAAMKRQELPDHIKVIVQKRSGPRVRVASAHYIDRRQITLAHWPEDGLSEYAIPIWACVVGGTADLLIADYALRCQAGDMIFFPSGIPKCNSMKPHFIGDASGRFCDVLWISSAMPTKGLLCYLCHSTEMRHLPLERDEHCLSRNLFLQQLFEGFSEELERNGPSDEAIEILLLIMRLFKRDIDEEIALSPAHSVLADQSKNESRNPIEEACLYIDSHIELQLTINKVARQVYLSPTHFTRRFREHTGQSFKEYLTAQRLKKAVRLLEETTMTVRNISYYVGLTSGQLRNLFHANYNCSPVEYRKQYRHS